MFDKITNYIQKQSKWFWITILVTIIIDALNTAYFEIIQDFFYNILEGKDLKSIIYLISIYVLFIVLLIFIGMMSSYETKRYPNKIQKFSNYLTFFMIAGYGVILMMPAINILGVADNKSNFTDNQQFTWFMILIGLYFVMFVFGFVEFKTRFRLGKPNYFYIYVPVLIMVSLFVDFSTALWKFQLFDPENVADPNRASRFIEFVAVFPLYALFYSAPRFVLVRKTYNLLPILSAILSTMYFVWKSLEYMEL
jgi:membrane-associated HD superfamily phosphohydrolase